MKHRIPYGIANFEEIRKNDKFYYVDNTRYIHYLEKYKTPVFLRPRRFGKTLWCSILEYYYDINHKEKFNELFGDLEIGKNPTWNQNQFMVLRLNFSKVSVSKNLIELENNFNFIVNLWIKSFLQYYNNYFTNLKLDKEPSASKNLENIVSYIKLNNLPQMYLIIDEYDNFTNQLITNYEDQVYKNVTDKWSWLQTFFKVIKAWVEEWNIWKTYITWVLPITIDDLTSGFNIAQFITLELEMINMLWFTQDNVNNYLENIFDEYDFDKSQIPMIQDTIKTNYNWYRFNEKQVDLIYNSTLLNYFLDKLIRNKWEIPEDLIDENLSTDLKWIQRITLKIDNTKELLKTLLNKNEISYNRKMIKSKFNMNHFFQKDHYPVSFFYLGLLTIKDEYKMQFPNLTMRSIFTWYFDEIENIDVVTLYWDLFQNFLDNPKIEDLFEWYRNFYISQIPAQVFDQMNENFFRTTFFNLMSMFLSNYFIFWVEYQVPTGRIDYIMIWKFNNKFKKQVKIIEFKYRSKEKWIKEKILQLKQANSKDIDQINRYWKDIQNWIYKWYSIEKIIIYIVSNTGYVSFKI